MCNLFEYFVFATVACAQTRSVNIMHLDYMYYWNVSPIFKFPQYKMCNFN